MKLLLAFILSLAALNAGAVDVNLYNVLDKAFYPTTYGTAGQCWVSGGAGVAPNWATCDSVGTGTVTSVSVVTANGVSGSVANQTTTPAITLTLGAITPSSVVNAGAYTGTPHIGGIATTNQTLELRTSSGNSTSGDVIKFTGKNNGATEFGRFAYGSNGATELLIGTATPLNISGYNALAIDGTNTAIKLLAGGTVVGSYFTSSGDFYLADGGTGSIFFATNANTATTVQAAVKHTSSATQYPTLTGTNGGGGLISASAGGLTIDSGTTANLVLKYNNVATLTIGAANTPLTVAGLTTGTNADTLCLSSGGVVLIQAAACTISSLRFKENVEPFQRTALDIVAALRPIKFTMKVGGKPNGDWNYDKPQVGLAAENVADVIPLAAIYEQDGITPKSYRQEALIAVTIKALQEQQTQIDELRDQIRGRLRVSQ